jgi:NAD(P)-dependent dehydrogenase (short-subunit alcohol dehydrogenase family)
MKLQYHELSALTIKSAKIHIKANPLIKRIKVPRGTIFFALKQNTRMQKKDKKAVRPPQRQSKPGKEHKMKPHPIDDYEFVMGSNKLEGNIALITGGDSGIGRAVAIRFAKEGADLAIVYLNEHDDANQTKCLVESMYGRRCLLLPGDVSKERFCISCVDKTIKEYGRIDILVNNAGVHFEAESLAEMTTNNLEKTFATNVFSFFWVTKAALPHMRPGSSIINTTSVTAYRGSGHLLDYSATKGAVVSFTRSLSANLAERKIRVNAVAPGPIWTPLIVSSFSPKEVAKFGSDVPLKRAGQPAEVAGAFLFLACNEDSSFITGQVIHPNGGEIING